MVRNELPANIMLDGRLFGRSMTKLEQNDDETDTYLLLKIRNKHSRRQARGPEGNRGFPVGRGQARS
jgi:hypothetical protein